MDFDLGERVFGRLWRRWRPSAGDREARQASFAAFARSADAIAAMLAGQRLRIREAEGRGGVRGRTLLLPHPDDVPGETHVERISFLGVRLVHSVGVWLRRAAGESAFPTTEAAFLAEALAAEAWLFAELPGMHGRYAAAQQAERAARELQDEFRAPSHSAEGLRRAVLQAEEADRRAALDRIRLLRPPLAEAGFWLWGGLLTPAEIEEADADSQASSESADRGGVAENASERDARVRDFVRRAMLDQEVEKEATPEHVFEKIQTLEEFVGGRRRLDGADELEDHGQALEELDLREVIRGGPQAESVYRVELDAWDSVPDLAQIDPGEQAVMYDEWHSAAGTYRKDWAAVYPCLMRASVHGWAAPQLAEQRLTRERLAARLRVRRERRSRQRRQWDGDRLDLGQYILDRGAECAGHPASGRIFERRRPLHRDLACSVLLDLSLSADGWVDDRRVLDATRSAALLLGEVSLQLGDPFRLQAFASQTRHRNRVWTLKDWHENWWDCRDRLGALQTRGYTRIGPAIRHATAGMERLAERRRLLLILTDGKPTDFDRYEGRYGREDVRQAVREAAQKGVRVHAIGFDPQVAHHLGEMFGVGAWSVPRNGQLEEAVLAAYARFGC